VHLSYTKFLVGSGYGRFKNLDTAGSACLMAHIVSSQELPKFLESLRSDIALCISSPHKNKWGRYLVRKMKSPPSHHKQRPYFQTRIRIKWPSMWYDWKLLTHSHSQINGFAMLSIIRQQLFTCEYILSHAVGLEFLQFRPVIVKVSENFDSFDVKFV
jgi:hypothetical protein